MGNILRRKTSSGTFIPEIDGLRFFAIITVVIYHMNSALSRSLSVLWQESYMMMSPTSLGWWLIRLDLGVKVFFALSGFILAIPFIKNLDKSTTLDEIKSYLVRRLLRLEPPYLISLVLFFVGRSLLPGLQENIGWTHLLANMFYIHGFVFGNTSPVNPVTWSLETEAQFYLAMPILFWVMSSLRSDKLRVFIMLLLFCFGLFLRKFIFSNDIMHLSFSAVVYMTNFLTGISFAFLYVKTQFLKKNDMLIFDVLGVIALFGMFIFYKPQLLYMNNTLFNLSIFLFFIGVFKGKVLNWLATRKIIYTIGGMCYTIYLYHYGILEVLARVLKDVINRPSYTEALCFFAFIALPILGLIVVALYLLVEKPFMGRNLSKDAKVKSKS